MKDKKLLLFIIIFSSTTILLFLLLIALPYFGKINPNPSYPNNYVTRVIDGDTFKINSGETIRFLCVDTPERRQEGYEEAKEFLESLILNKEVQFNSSITDKDSYGRLLRYVYVNKTFVNKLVLDEGYGGLLIIPPEDCREILD